MEHERMEGDLDDPRPSSAGGFHRKINRSFDYDSEMVEQYNPDDSRYSRGRRPTLDISSDSQIDTRLASVGDSAAGHIHGDHVPATDAYPQTEDDVGEADFVTVDMDNTGELAKDFVDDTLDSVILEDRHWSGGADPYAQGELSGMENEAYSYDGDAETDLSRSHPNANANADPGMEPPVLRQPDPFPVLERPLSGRYQKNPVLERQKTPAAPGPYDPNIGVFLAPPLATTKPDAPPSPRKRLPRPPSRVKMRCALSCSCAACLIGSFLCAIPALRYYVTANESRKIGDYNSAHSFLRKSALLALVALALGVGAWVIVILYLSDSL